MSWYAELAEKAENLLVNIDDEPIHVIHHAPRSTRNKSRQPKRYNSRLMDRNQQNQINVKKVKTTLQSRSFPLPNSHDGSPIRGRCSPKESNTKHGHCSHDGSPIRGRCSPKESNTKHRHCEQSLMIGQRDMSPLSRLQQCSSCLPSPKIMNRAPDSTPPSLKRNLKSGKPFRKSVLTKSPVRDAKDENIAAYGYKPTRANMAGDLKNATHAGIVAKMQQIAMENAVLKNEINLTNREIKELMDRLCVTETELENTLAKLEALQKKEQALLMDQGLLAQNLDQYKAQLDSTKTEMNSFRDQNFMLKSEISMLREEKNGLESLMKALIEETKNRELLHCRLEKDLMNAQSTINTLQAEVHKSSEECKRLVAEMDAYKHRMREVIAGKEKEIEALKEGNNLTEDSKLLVEQIESLKAERQELSGIARKVRGECQDMNNYVKVLESKYSAVERLVVALRHAYQKQHALRTEAEARCAALNKELKTQTMEKDRTIERLKAMLHEKNKQMLILDDRATSSSSYTESDAINVADFETTYSSRDDDGEKFESLCHKMLQQQGVIDMLRTDNSMLKIQLQKLEGKYREDILKITKTESRQLLESGRRTYFWRILNFYMRSNPLCKLFIIGYVVCLHLWVVSALLNSFPEKKFQQFQHMKVLKE